MPYANISNSPNLSGLSGGFLSKQAKKIKKTASKVGKTIKNAASETGKTLRENEAIVEVAVATIPGAGPVIVASYEAGKAIQTKKKIEAEAKKVRKQAKALDAEAAAAERARADEIANKPAGPSKAKIAMLAGAAAVGMLLFSKR